MAPRRDRRRSPPSDFRLETLETRVLFSADMPLAVLGAPVEPVPHEALVVPVATIDAPSADGAQVRPLDASDVVAGEHELVVIDAGVPDLDALLADFEHRGEAGPRTVVLEPGGDPLARLGEILAGEQGLSAVHLVSHGADGELVLGGERVTTIDLLARAGDIVAWRAAFADGADLLLYGCDVAASADGRAFVDTLARLAGVDVGASTDATGAARLGGDWQLEYARGELQGRVAIGAALRERYSDTLSQYTVTDFSDPDSTTMGTLRWAIEKSNADDILFAGPGTIVLSRELPAITTPTTIDATTIAGYDDTPLVTIDGDALFGNRTGLRLEAGSDGSIVRGLRIVNFPDDGIRAENSGSHVIESNHIGIDGTNARGNADDGIHLQDSANNTIGGATAAKGNVISGNGFAGVFLRGSGSSGNVVMNNLIGTNATGTAALGNSEGGIYLVGGATGNKIGGLVGSEGNVVSGNDAPGVIFRGGAVSGNRIEGNFIGTNAAGTAGLGNAFAGVNIRDRASDNFIGGPGSDRGNVISGNRAVSDNFGSGVLIADADSDDNVVSGNIIGLAADGDTVLGNDEDGILVIFGASGTRVGAYTDGADVYEGNVISGNGASGVSIDGFGATAATGNVVAGNLIGTDATGLLARGNGYAPGAGNVGAGVQLFGGVHDNVIGGAIVAERNVISGNTGHGVHGAGNGTDDNRILGNYIGTDLVGDNALGNTIDGVHLTGGANDTVVGVAGAGNLISGNDRHGIHMHDTGTDGTTIKGNEIGTAAGGGSAIPNAKVGVLVTSEAKDTVIGGDRVAGEGNLVSGNGLQGIYIAGNGTDRTLVYGNRIGTTGDGDGELGNGGTGLLLLNGARNTLVGGIGGLGNLVSGNGAYGIGINGAGTDSNTFAGNMIGTNAAGSSPLANDNGGVRIVNGASDNIVGGDRGAGEGNTISGNDGTGVRIEGVGTSNNKVQGNLVGTDASGNGRLGNLQNGIIVRDQASANLVGGPTPGEGNIVSGNLFSGIVLRDAGTAANVLENNFVGTRLDGNSALGNGNDGVRVEGGVTGTVVGGATDRGNVVSGNAQDGIELSGADLVGSVVSGNTIGLGRDGDTIVPNARHGMVLYHGAHGTLVGADGTGHAGNTISGNGFAGIVIDGRKVPGTSGNTVAGNRIGTDATGTLARGNGSDGIQIFNAAHDNTIGGTTVAARNIVSANGTNGIGIFGADTRANRVIGNLIGTDAFGSSALANRLDGVRIGDGAKDNVIGGDRAAGEGNVVSGNGGNGIELVGGETVANRVLGNRIGTDTTGTLALANDRNGVIVHYGASDNEIGGSGTGEGNLLSGNRSSGVEIARADTTGNRVSGNRIGTDADGNSAVPNGADGVWIRSGASGNTVGGDERIDEGNLISGNDGSGVQIDDADANVVSGNRIGTDVLGKTRIENDGAGVGIAGGSSSNVVGGDATAGEGNLLSGNAEDGVHVEGAGSDANEIRGNLVGTDESGTARLGNGDDGVRIGEGARATVVGGSATGAGNLVSANGGIGIAISGVDTDDTLVLGNLVGTAADGGSALGNDEYGVLVSEAATGTRMGGTAVGEGNVVSGNVSHGIAVFDAGTTGTSIVANRVGTTGDGMGAVANGGDGMVVGFGASLVTIGGPRATGAGNLVSANLGNGVSVEGTSTGDVSVHGNGIGVDALGDGPLGNGVAGVRISDSGSNVIGGDRAAGLANVISSNGTDGVTIVSTGAVYNRVEGNLIGTDLDGALDLGNDESGVRLLAGANGNVIGGLGTLGNLVSGNGEAGVRLDDGGTDANRIIGNRIGTDEVGTGSIANAGDGILIDNGPSGTRIGGSVAQGNVISGNGANGVQIKGDGSDDSVLAGNTIGLGADGTTVLANDEAGVLVRFGPESTLIGVGRDAANLDNAGNTISANGSYGIGIRRVDTLNVVIAGNIVGLDAGGTLARGNGDDGINVDQSPGVRIGGGAGGERNVVSANTGDGIQVSGVGASGTLILGNRIGTSADGSTALGNMRAGIRLDDGATATQVGDGGAGEGNLVSGNERQGILVDGMDGVGTIGNIIQGNRIGTDTDGTVAMANGNGSSAAIGIEIVRGALDTMIGGDADANEGNHVAGHALGVGISVSGAATSGTGIFGNFVGTTADGNGPLGNRTGIEVDGAVDTTIGDAATGFGNLLSGNLEDGLHVFGATTGGMAIVGNRVGTGASGLASNANQRHGMSIAGGSSITIGGTAANAGNLVSANGDRGISISGADDVTLIGNLLGTDATGNVGLGNIGVGVVVGAGSNDIVVGSVGSGNVVSDNGGSGIETNSGVSNASIVGNVVGLGRDGSTRLGNAGAGMKIDSPDVLIGGTAVEAGNVVSDNRNNGLQLGGGSHGARLLNNLIGLDGSGTLDRGNTFSGLFVGSDGNSIGESGHGNTIAGSSHSGIYLTGADSNSIVGNRIGTALDGTTDIGNTYFGIQITDGSSDNLVGGLSAADANTIRDNGLAGISVTHPAATGNTFLRNVIADNGGLAIDLGPTGVNADDSDDVDGGANDLQNSPTLSRVGTDGVGRVEVEGAFHSVANTDYRIDVYAAASAGPSGNAQAERHLGSIQFTTDAAGNAGGVLPIAAVLAEGEFVGVTATRLGGGGEPGSTSEFSEAVVARELNVAPAFTSGDFTIDENLASVGTVVANDANDDTISYAIDGGADAALFTIDVVTGDLSFVEAPDHDAPGDADADNVHDIRVVASDGRTETRQDLTVTVTNVNEAPVLGPISDLTVDEGDTASVTVSAVDSDVPADTLTYSLDAGSLGRGMTIGASDGVFSWTPDEAQGGSALPVTVTVTDDGAGTKSASETFTVTVDETNSPPVLDSIGNQTIDENQALSFTVTASDPDVPADTLTYSLDAASIGLDMTIDGSSGVFSWTPGENRGGLEPTVIVTVTDGKVTDSKTFTVKVNDTNSPPVLDSIGNQTIDENRTLSFEATASDSDDQGDKLTYSLDADSLALGMTIGEESGEFSWTPGESRGGSALPVTVTVTDNGTGALTDSETFTVTVDDTNSPPVLDPIGNQTIDENRTLSFKATASDSDDQGDKLTYSLDADSFALGMTIGEESGEFSWTPGESQGGSVLPVTVTVTDNGTGALIDSKTFAVTVTDTNAAPVLDPIDDKTIDETQALSFTVTATDSDVPADKLTYTLDAASIGLGMTIGVSDGMFSWTPDEDQGGIAPTVTVTVTDDGATADGAVAKSASQEFVVRVTDTNTAPVIEPIDDKTIDETQTLSFAVTASDGDVPENDLTYSLDPASIGLGMTIGVSDGEFNWTPDESQGGSALPVTVTVTDNGTGALTDSETFTVTVTDTNTVPVLEPIDDKTIDETQTLSFAVTANDGDVPENDLTYSLDPASIGLGMTIGVSDGMFGWTPDEDQGGIAPTVTVTVTDDGVVAKSASQEFVVRVTDTNTAPVIEPIGDKAIDENQALSFAVTATDSDVPADKLTYSLDDASIGLGMTIGASDGEFNWTPSESQGGLEPMVTVAVTDDGATADGAVAKSASQEFVVRVTDTNTAPVIEPIGDKTIDENQALSFMVTANDPDVPAGTLTYSLDADSLALGMTIGKESGEFSWTPGESQGGSALPVTVTVTDNGTGALTDSEMFVLTVTDTNTVPVLDPIGDKTIDENQALSFAVTATDSDVPADKLTYSLDAASIGLGMTIGVSDGMFSWTPDEDQGGIAPTVTVTVTDDGATADGAVAKSASQEFVVRVTDTNTAPVIEPIGDKTIDETQTLSFAVTATDSDVPADKLTYTLDAASIGLGMTIGVSDGMFSWTPGEDQGGIAPTVTVTVTDDGATADGAVAKSASQEFVVRVTDTNTAPVIEPIGDKTIDENQALSFIVTANDPDVPVGTLTYSLDVDSLALGMTIGEESGELSWTPGESQGGSVLPVTVTVTDNGTGALTDSKTFALTVTDTNTAPVLEPIDDKTVDENQALSFIVTANDPDVPVGTLTYSLDADSLALGMTIGKESGEFSWTPGESRGGSALPVTVTVTDNGTGALTDSKTFALTVTDTNTAPVLEPIDDKTVDENQALSFIVTANDPDVPVGTLTYSLDADSLALGMTIGKESGEFSWTPGESRGGSALPVTVTVTDDGAGTKSASETFTVTVDDTNSPPVLDPIGNQTIDENRTLSFKATASDSDDQGDKLTYSLDANSLALGMTIGKDSGELSWTPGESQGDSVLSVTVTVTDDGAGTKSASETFTVTVDDTNSPPVLDPIGNQTIDENRTLSFEATASDSDDQGDKLTHSLDADSLALGMTIGEESGEFSWTPGESQGGSVLPVTVTVTDNGTGALADSKTFAVTVTDTNTAPVIEPIDDKTIDETQTLSFAVTASDGDVPENDLTYSLDPASIGLGMTIGVSDGEFNWTPDESQGGSAHPVTVTVTDNGTGALTDSETFTVTVTDTNTVPVLEPIDDKTTDETQTLSFEVKASDPDEPADTLTYTLDAASIELGMTIGVSDGMFSWTPDEDQGGIAPTVTVTVTDDGATADGAVAKSASQEFVVRVTDTNTVPVIEPIGDKTIDENQTLSFIVTANDPDVPAGTLTYSLDADSLALGMTIGKESGEFSWTPGESRGGSALPVTVTVTDDGAGTKSVSKTFTVTVDDTNSPPVLDSIGNQTIDENRTLSFEVKASDEDDPENTLTYRLDAASLGLGMTIDEESGEFNWTPSESQGGLTPSVTVTVTDDGTGTLTDSKTFAVTVTDTNTAPVIEPIDDKTIDETRTLSFEVKASDEDNPGNTLTYSLDAASLALGMTIDEEGGEFNWTPSESQGGLTPSVIVTVTDNGTGALTDSETFTVTVNDTNTAPTLDPIGDRTIGENTTSIATVTASDDDVPSDTLLYNLGDSADRDAFTIDPDTGTLGFLVAPDFESPGDADADNVYDVRVEVSDGTGSDAEDVRVSVADVNDTPPSIAPDQRLGIAENAVAGTLAGTVEASDPDADGTVGDWKIEGGDGAGIFAVDAATGEVRLREGVVLDRETRPLHALELSVGDGGQRSATGTVFIDVNDIDEAPIANADRLSGVEDVPLMIDVASELFANDADPEGEPLRLVGVTAPAHGTFAAADDGMLKYRPEADFNGRDAFEYTVEDAAGQHATASVTIDVAPVNDPPTIAPAPDGATGARPGIIDAPSIDLGWMAVDENTDVVGIVEAFDVDDADVTFALGGADAELFEIDAATGALRPFAPLDFERANDADGDNRYELELVLRDSAGGESRLPFTVLAADVNESPVMVDGAFGAVEGDSGTIGQLSASDPDRDDSLSFELVDGDDAARAAGFALSPDGQLTAAAPAAGNYAFAVRVVDARGLESIARVTVTVRLQDDGSGPPSLGSASPENLPGESPIATPSESSSDGPASIGAEPAPPPVVSKVAARSAPEPARSPSALSPTHLSYVPSVDGGARFGVATVIPSAAHDIPFTTSMPERDVADRVAVAPTVYRFSVPLSARWLDSVESLRDGMDEREARAEADERFLVRVSTVAGVTVSVGAAFWLLQSRLLLAAALTAMPLWRPVDPVPVLIAGSGRRRERNGAPPGDADAGDADD